MFYLRLAPPATPDSKKFSRPRRSFPESRFSQAGKASDGVPGWIRSSPGARPRPQRPLWAPTRASIAAPAAAESPQRHPEASRSDPERFGAICPAATLRPRATASIGRRPRTSPAPRRILPAQRGKCRRPFTSLPAAKGNPTRPRRPSMSIRQRLPRPATATVVDMPARTWEDGGEGPGSVQDGRSKPGGMRIGSGS